MAQITGAVSETIVKLEVSVNGTNWTDVSGALASFENSGGDILIGEQMTADGEEAIVVSSLKMAPRDLTFGVVYTEGTNDPFKVIFDVYQGTTKLLYVRWSPRGGAATQKRYVTSVAGVAAAVPVVSCQMPGHDPGGSGVALASFSVRTPGILEETISGS